jgi:hypothetical protein
MEGGLVAEQPVRKSSVQSLRYQQMPMGSVLGIVSMTNVTTNANQASKVKEMKRPGAAPTRNGTASRWPAPQRTVVSQSTRISTCKCNVLGLHMLRRVDLDAQLGMI